MIDRHTTMRRPDDYPKVSAASMTTKSVESEQIRMLTKAFLSNADNKVMFVERGLSGQNNQGRSTNEAVVLKSKHKKG